MAFQIHALPAGEFQHLFALSDTDLAQHNARRMTVDTHPGCPCRVSLEEALIGEEVILVHYEHQPEQTPYRAGHAIFVRPGVKQACPAANEIPEVLRQRLISVRAFDDSHFIREADVVPGTQLKATIDAMFDDERVAYIHLHNAKPGCYAARATRL